MVIISPPSPVDNLTTIDFIENMADNHNSIQKQPKFTNSASIVPVELQDNKLVTTYSRCHDKTPVYKALSSLLLSLLFGGLIFKNEFSKTGIKRHLTASRIYSFIVLIFLSFNTFRWLTMFQNNDKFGSGVGVTKAPFVNFSVSEIFDLAKVPVRLFE